MHRIYFMRLKKNSWSMHWFLLLECYKQYMFSCCLLKFSKYHCCLYLYNKWQHSHSMCISSKWMRWYWGIIFEFNIMRIKHKWFISLVNKYHHRWILYRLLCNNSLDHVRLHVIVGLRMNNYSYFRHIQIIICIKLSLFYIWVLHYLSV